MRIKISRPVQIKINEEITTGHLITSLDSLRGTNNLIGYLTSYYKRGEITFYQLKVLHGKFDYLRHFNWQTIYNEWRGVQPVITTNAIYSIHNLDFQSSNNDCIVDLNEDRIYSDPKNKQKRVIYIGYWLNNNNVKKLVNSWNAANITHVLFTFITQPDIKQPLSAKSSMIDAWNDPTFSPESKAALTDKGKNSFILGVSYGGASKMPSPYSQTFAEGSYYYNNPSQLANDLIKLCPEELRGYFDLDIEQINDQFDECADFIGKICQELKKNVPSCVISQAPQTPYFTSTYASPGSDPVCMVIYNKYKEYFDWFNIQYYNNGPSDTYEEIFVKSNESMPNTSVLEIINSGVDPSYIVVGKPVNKSEGDSGGFVPLTDLSNYVKQAFENSDLKTWAENGGEMIWYYNTQQDSGANVSNILIEPINQNFKLVSQEDPQKDNESIVTFFSTVSALPSP